MTGEPVPTAMGGAGVGDLAAGRADGAEAVRLLFRDHHLELVRLALMMVGDAAAAEDVVQDTYERLHRRWRAVREPSKGLAYARSCVLNGCRSAHRRSAIARKYAPRLAERTGEVSPDASSAVDDSAAVVAALRLLTRRQREVVVLRYYADLEVPEIAGTLQVSEAAVRATMNRALAVLARVLREEQP
jgi:RNA polymerase sigma factor (sigma-70 family)